MGADPQWLVWAKCMQAIAQTGLTYATSEFDVQRYTALRQVASEMIADGFGLPGATVSQRQNV